MDDMDALTEDFVPERLLHREGQVRAVAEALDGNCFVWGPPGTGKTCASRLVLAEARGNGVKGAVVNCWRTGTKFGVVAEVLRALDRFVVRQGRPYEEALEALSKTKGKKIVVLDEVDRLNESEVLYDFLSMSDVRLLLISNEEHALAGLDARIQSRLAGIERVEFPRYRDGELVDILQERMGLLTEKIDHTILRNIADVAAGDCRVALRLLRKALEKGEGSLLSEKHKKEELNDYQILILDVLKGQMRAGELLAALEQACRTERLTPIQPRTFSKYMEQLVAGGFVTAEGQGRWRVYRKN